MSSEIKITDQSIICRVNSNNLIETLQQEENKLLVKLQKASDENNFGDYKMLIRNLTEVTKLKQQEMQVCKYDKKVIHSMYIDVVKNANNNCTSIFYKNKKYVLNYLSVEDLIHKIDEISQKDNFNINICGTMHKREFVNKLEDKNYNIKWMDIIIQ